MKKIVALVLSLVMVLGLASTAFAAITLWSPNGETVLCDIYDGKYNTKSVDGVEVTFTPAKELKVNKDGVVVVEGNIPYYTVASYTDLFVLVDKIPADANAQDYVLVKKHNPAVLAGQTSPDALYILKAVDAVTYTGVATAFTAWSDACELYANPDVYDTDGKAWPYYTVTKGIGVDFATAGGFVAKVPAAAATVNGDPANVLVGDTVVTLDLTVAEWVFATKHTWAASKWDATGAATHYTCANCKTEGTVINASINAPAGAKIDNVNGVLIAYFYTAPTAGGNTAAGGSTVESAKTFDAGIAMYVGMSVMAAAGSAVVLKKKD